MTDPTAERALRPMKTMAWAALAALVLACGAVQAQKGPKVEPLTAEELAAGAALARSANAPRAERQEIRAQLTPRRYTTVAAEIGARIRRLPVAEGLGFQEGDLLVDFDCSLQQAQLDKARADLDGAQATFKSNEKLVKLNAIGELELDLSRVAVAKAKAEVDGQSVLISKCRITAPFGGRVAEQKVREQQYVQPGQALIDILDDSVLELEFLVPSSWLRWLKVGQSLKVSIDETRKTYPARYTRIGAKVDPVSQSVKVVAAIDGQFSELIAGMSGRVQATVP